MEYFGPGYLSRELQVVEQQEKDRKMHEMNWPEAFTVVGVVLGFFWMIVTFIKQI